MTGGRGNDVTFLDRGDDRFTWNPGDGDDNVEGQEGNDVLTFNGANLPERMEATPNGRRVRLFRNVANINMDFQGSSASSSTRSADPTSSPSATSPAPTSRPPTSTWRSATAPAMPPPTPSSPPAAAGPTRVRVTRSGAQVLTTGLAAQTRIAGSEAANDTLVVDTLAGNDEVDVAPDVADLIRTSVDLRADEFQQPGSH